MRVALTGGGTGGHITPNIAVVDELRKKDSEKKDVEILYIGSKNGPEKKLIEKLGIAYKGVHCGKFRRYFSIQNFIDIFKVPIGIIEAYRILKKFSPDVLFSKGGYVGVPSVLAANFLGIPIIIHESDFSPGLSNRICFKYAKKICLSFEETASYVDEQFHYKIVVTGNPVRKNLSNGDKNAGYKFTGFDGHRPVILAIGGSQGALQINELIRANLNEFLKKFQIVHIVGRGNLDIGTHKKGYVQYEYLDEPLKDIYAICDLVITRGGANSLAELAYLKKKVLVIPLGGSGSRGEQYNNAYIFAKEIGWSILTDEVKNEDFVNTVKMAFKNNINESYKFKNGVDEIVNLILKTKK